MIKRDLKTGLLLSIYKDKSYLEFFKRVGGDYGDDLQQYIAEVIMGLKPEFFNQFSENGKFRYWVYSIAHRSFNYKSSDFYKEHLRHEYINPKDIEVEDYDFSKDIKLHIIESILIQYEAEHKDNWYDVLMFKKYLEYSSPSGRGAKKISEKTGIPYSSVRSSIYHMKKVIKERYNQNQTQWKNQ